MIVSDVAKDGVVKRASEGRVTVEIFCGEEACRGCKMSSLCPGEKNTVDIEANVADGVSVGVGDRVIVVGRIKGWFAGWLMLAGLPILALLAAVVAGFLLELRDGAIGALAIGVTVAYYICLYLLRRKVNGRVEWIVEQKRC